MQDHKLHRRELLKIMGLSAASLALVRCAGQMRASRDEPPNIILCMADDQGWHDTGYYGHPHLKTPTLDAMARSGIRFDRFYAGVRPTCSST